MSDKLKDKAAGRWRVILTGLGFTEAQLSGKHGPCPICREGKDRFRWDDKGGTGTYFCNSCGAGDGVALVMKTLGVPFADAARRIDALIPGAAVDVARAASSPDRLMARALGLWAEADPLDGCDPASRYLAKRGISTRSSRPLKAYPTQLRVLRRTPYTHLDKTRTHHPAMIAKVLSPDGAGSTIHLTYLDGHGNKASLDPARKMAPGRIPDGGAVRLSMSAETMGLAEGIETALSASLLHDVPVWAALSSNGMIKWSPPKTVKHVLVFADSDASFDGQYKAFALAYRLRKEGFAVEVRLPDEIGTDWNDLLMAEVGALDVPVRHSVYTDAVVS